MHFPLFRLTPAFPRQQAWGPERRIHMPKVLRKLVTEWRLEPWGPEPPQVQGHRQRLSQEWHLARKNNFLCSCVSHYLPSPLLGDLHPLLKHPEAVPGAMPLAPTSFPSPPLPTFKISLLSSLSLPPQIALGLGYQSWRFFSCVNLRKSHHLSERVSCL